MEAANHSDFFTVLSSIATAVAALASLWAAWTSKSAAQKSIENANLIAKNAEKNAAKIAKEEKIRWLTDLARDSAKNFNLFTNDKGLFEASEASIAQFYYSFSSFISHIQKSSPNEHKSILDSFWVFLSPAVQQEVIEGRVLHAFFGIDDSTEDHDQYGQMHFYLRGYFLDLKGIRNNRIPSVWVNFQSKPSLD